MRTTLFLVFFISASIFVKAQIVLPDYIIAKLDDGKIKVRWEPGSISEWNDAMEKGYQVSLYKVESNGIENRIANKTILPKKYGEWDDISSKGKSRFPEMWESAKAFLFPDKIKESIVNDLKKTLVKESPETLDSLRLNFVSYFSIFDQNLAEAVGLGTSLDVSGEGEYRIVIGVDGYAPHSSIYNSLSKIPSSKLKVNAEWSDREVKMRWATEKRGLRYFGYIVEKSEKDGKFYKLNELPYLDPAVGMEGARKDAVVMVHDSLMANYITYHYRIRAMDYFGDLAEGYTSVSGYGYDKLSGSPALIMADQMTTNQAYLEWQVAIVDVPLIRDFTILRSDAIDGKYEIALQDINKDQRSAKIKMEYEKNYFRIESNPIDGDPISSMPVFVMGMDTIAPAQPVTVHATIDTNGAVQILWAANQEPDLGGYRVFRANFSDQEYSLLNADPTIDTFYIDTVALNLGTKNVFYLIQACDKRNNRSLFSEPIVLEKPDIIPPGKPIIQQLEQLSDTLAIHWIVSGSPDAEIHKLFKRNLDKESAWTLVAVFDSTNISSPFYDTSNPYGEKIAYTMMAIDRAKLESGLTKMKVKILEQPEQLFEPFISIDTTFNRETGTVSVSWKCNDEENLESVLVYRGFQKEKLGKYKYIDSPVMHFEDEVGNNELVFYTLKPVYRNQDKSHYSDIIEFKNYVNTRQ